MVKGPKLLHVFLVAGTLGFYVLLCRRVNDTQLSSSHFMIAIWVLNSFSRGCFLSLEKIIQLCFLLQRCWSLWLFSCFSFPPCWPNSFHMLWPIADGHPGISWWQESLQQHVPCVQCSSSSVWNENQAALGQSNHAPMGWGNAQLKVGLGLVLICFVIVLFPPYILCPIHTNHSQSWFFFFLFLHLS